MQNIDPYPIPAFSTLGEKILTGDEEQFTGCKKAFDEFVAAHRVEPLKEVYSFSEKWGFTLRVFYKRQHFDLDGMRDFDDEQYRRYTKGTWICWEKTESNIINTAIDIPGNLNDIG